MNSYNFAKFQKRPMDKKVRGDFASLTLGPAGGCALRPAVHVLAMSPNSDISSVPTVTPLCTVRFLSLVTGQRRDYD